MITTILIVLVAVVVLIVIIAVLALRYLRADDSDVFDDIPDEPRPRRGPDHNSGEFPVSPGRRQRQPVTEAWPADRPPRQADARGQQPGFRDRDTGPRPAVPERADGQRRAAAAARPARAGRAADADAVTSSWESLSDVDYWTELAADKSPMARGERGQVPALQRRQPARPVGSQPGRGAEPTLPPPSDFDAPGRRGGPRPGAAPRPAAGQRSGPPSRPQLPAAQAPPAAGHRGSGGPSDDDPLTSPSFPAINAADSRSYRTRRSGTSQQGITGPDGYPASSDRTSRPDGYPVQSPAPRSARHANGSHSASQRAAQAAAQAPPPGPPSSSSAPAANPYGSFVSAQPAQQHPSYPDIAAASRSTADYPGHSAASQPTAGNGRHSAPSFGNGGAAGSAADGYLPAGTLGAAGPASNGNAQGYSQSHPHNGSSPSGYAGIDYGSLRYDDPLYPDGDGSGLVGYAAPRQRGKHYDPAYGGSDPGYGQDGYQGYPGNGAGER